MTIGKRLYALIYYYLLSNRGHPAPDNAFTRDVLSPLLAKAGGDVLEIGAGNGDNLLLYPPDTRLTLLDPNPFMLYYLRRAYAGQEVFRRVMLVEGTGEHLPFPDRRFDAVVTTHVLCSVRDQMQTLAEIRRVLRPAGVFLFVEHVLAAPGTATRYMQQLVNPAWKIIAGGCHLTRDTGAAIRAAGFRSVELTTLETGFPFIVSTQIVGVARV